MKTITSVRKMQEFSRQVRGAGLTVGFVPTMGYLHEGHMELVRRAREASDVVVVSIFVNPTQFDRKDDFEKYPRNDARDRELLERERVDVLFAPEAGDVYRADAATSVRVSRLDATLCGPQRPGHFDGVTTVVASLLNMVGPDRAWFGEKDYQQLQIVRRMVRDLHFPVEIVAAPTVREADGLAMSSRNARLTAEERAVAPALQRALRAAMDVFLGGEARGAEILGAAHAVLGEHEAIRVEYLELVDGVSLEVIETANDGSVLAAAAWLGGVRLIDNVVFSRARAREVVAAQDAECAGAGPGAGLGADSPDAGAADPRAHACSGVHPDGHVTGGTSTDA